MLLTHMLLRYFRNNSSWNASQLSIKFSDIVLCCATLCKLHILASNRFYQWTKNKNEAMENSSVALIQFRITIIIWVVKLIHLIQIKCFVNTKCKTVFFSLYVPPNELKYLRCKFEFTFRSLFLHQTNSHNVNMILYSKIQSISLCVQQSVKTDKQSFTRQAPSFLVCSSKFLCFC